MADESVVPIYHIYLSVDASEFVKFQFAGTSFAVAEQIWRKFALMTELQLPAITQN